MKIMPRRFMCLSVLLFIGLISGGWAQAEQNKFWAMELGNYWDYVEGPSDTWPSRNLVANIDTTTPSPTFMVATAEYQGGPWVSMENWWYDINETGPSSSELRVWKIMFEDEGWVIMTFNSGIIWARRPMTVGDSWTSSATGTYQEGPDTFPMTINVNSEVLSYGPVDIPFGNRRYNAYRIRHIIDIPGLGQITQTPSIVPYLGIIKNEIVDDLGYEADSLSSMDIATVFDDTLYDHWAYPYVMQIYDAGLTVGCSQSPVMLYCPENLVPREQMAKFILTGLNQVPADGYCGAEKPFTDVPVDRWSCKYIKKLAELGITTGYEDGSFHPEEPISREGMATFLIRALNEVPADGYCGGESPFTDVSFDRWSCKYVKKFAELGITTGYGDGRYGPLDPVTRAQMAVFLTRSFVER